MAIQTNMCRSMHTQSMLTHTHIGKTREQMLSYVRINIVLTFAIPIIKGQSLKQRASTNQWDQKLQKMSKAYDSCSQQSKHKWFFKHVKRWSVNDIQKEYKLKLDWNSIFYPWDWQKSRSLTTMLVRVWKHALSYIAVGV